MSNSGRLAERGGANTPAACFALKAPFGKNGRKTPASRKLNQRKESGFPAFEVGWHHGEDLRPLYGQAGRGKVSFYFEKRVMQCGRNNEQRRSSPVPTG